MTSTAQLGSRMLDLDEACLDHPSRLHLSEIENWMLWPDDPAARTRAKETAMVQQSLRAANAGLLSPDAVLELANLAAVAPRPGDLVEDALRRYERGLYAGKILLDAVSKVSVGMDAALGPIMDEIKQRYLGRAATNSKAVNSKIWEPFRPVAHFWACHRFYRLRGHHVWPCSLERIPMFLAIAEDLRRISEGLRSHPKAPRTILEHGEAVQLAEAVAAKLPRGRLKIELIH